MTETITEPYRELFRCFVPNRPGEDPDDHEHDLNMTCDWGWCCNQQGCSERVDEQPCAHHAPIWFPGLRLVECQAEPRHWLFAHDRDDYGHGCPTCWVEQVQAKYANVSLCTHGWWQRGRWQQLLRRSGIVTVSGWQWGDGCRGCATIRWRWTR